MEAGRELDALIAEKVMDDMLAGIRLDGSPMFDDIPHYSTQIANAWLVVEKLRLFVQPSALGWHSGLRGDIQENHRHANTAPLAICLAALKAVEGV